MRLTLLLTIAVFVSISCSKKTQKTEEQPLAKITLSTLPDDSLLNLVEHQTFEYFWDNAEPTSGMGRERTHMDNDYPEHDQNVVTTGGSGFGLMAILVGIERHFITRQQGYERFNHIVNFLDQADRFHGAWPHWINGETGHVKPFGRKDNGGEPVETVFPLQGLLAVREYFKDGNADEKKMAAKIDKMWKEIEWDWYTHGKDVLYWHWSPEYQWEMNFPVGGYNECLIMYVLAASSPTHPIKPSVYHSGWARNDSIVSKEKYYDLDVVLDHYEHDKDPVGPMFWAHYSYLGLDPRHLKDKYADYWKLNQNHAMIQYKYAVDNPKHYPYYGPYVWGLTSSYSTNGYDAHRPTNDTGVISPTAALSDFPYTPKESMQFLRYIYSPEADSVIGEYGPYDAFDLQDHWMLRRYLAIDQGPIPVMIENYRTGLLWKLFMGAPEVQKGLDKLGFIYK